MVVPATALAQASTLRFPLSMSNVRGETDKKGEACITLDCCLNNDVVAMVRPLPMLAPEHVCIPQLGDTSPHSC